MRLPADAALILIGDPRGDEARAALTRVWRDEGLPIFSAAPDAFAGGVLEAGLDAIGATTLVARGAGGEAFAIAAAARGYRVFVVGEAPAGMAGIDARFVALDTALEAGRRAKARQRLKAGAS
jgi:hypothetical protein